MHLFEAAALDRKSGEAEGSAVRHSGAPNLPFNNQSPPLSSRSKALRRSSHSQPFGASLRQSKSLSICLQQECSRMLKK
jgi:hypothetical protein